MVFSSKKKSTCKQPKSVTAASEKDPLKKKKKTFQTTYQKPACLTERSGTVKRRKKKLALLSRVCRRCGEREEEDVAEETSLRGERQVAGQRLECCVPVIFQVWRLTNGGNDFSLLRGDRGGAWGSCPETQTTTRQAPFKQLLEIHQQFCSLESTFITLKCRHLLSRRKCEDFAV